MAEIKTKQTDASVTDFIDAFANNEQKRKDGHALLKLMQDFTGYEAKMWGPSIIGFGMYHYKSEKSAQEGDWPLVGFSPRKTAISLYVSMGSKTDEHLLKKLGKFKMGKACIYVNKLADIDQEVLKELIASTISLTQAKYGKL
ncbi:DUF1801 domain-containing protein [Pedobacter xixiisoli]|uniref:YdhG-like domain-containing protein n=1 Tax=Pedobacter xixiisoli TaxID=1476464 RepID=A0A285ZQC7_9SPHI|nr:DUF1801 domain-containing protein [Pedobacter xixiisoli]SOD11863.1 protein of unknown function (DU1801) [Pedobacter xixiisoli]